MSTFNITRYLHTSKKTKDGTAPLYGKINVGQSQKTFSFTAKLGIDLIDMNRWKATECFTNERKMTPVEREIKQMVEGELNALRRKAKRFVEDGKVFDAEDVYNTVYTQRREWTLMDAFEQHKKTFESEIGKGHKKASSYKKYATVKTHLETYLSERHRKKDFYLAQLDDSFQNSFLNHLKGKLNNYSQGKYVKHLRAVIKDAVEKGLISEFPFSSFKGCKPDNHKVFLTADELRAIADKTLSTERLNTVKDIFLFNCLTGYAWTDLSRLTHHEHVKEVNGRLVIFTKRDKTNVTAIVPLVKSAEAILAKYRHHPDVVATGKLFPFNTNQKMNEYLKEVQTVCGIEKTLTTKVARNTFATQALNNGVNINVLSRLMGHTNIKQTNEYAELLASTAIKEIDKLENLSVAV